jgi:hypothetical protein
MAYFIYIVAVAVGWAPHHPALSRYASNGEVETNAVSRCNIEIGQWNAPLGAPTVGAPTVGAC